MAATGSECLLLTKTSRFRYIMARILDATLGARLETKGSMTFAAALLESVGEVLPLAHSDAGMSLLAQGHREGTTPCFHHTSDHSRCVGQVSRN